MNKKVLSLIVLVALTLGVSINVLSAANTTATNPADQVIVTDSQSTTATQIAVKKDTFLDKLILYVPNRVLDFLDIFDVSLGFGPEVKAQAWVTRYFSFGGGVGGVAKLIKAYNRQYGAGLQSGWSLSFMMLSAEDSEMYETTRGVQKYFACYSGIPSINDNVYNFWKGPRDIFSIGAEGAIFGELDAEIHPFAIINFVTGFFFIDLKGDNVTMQDLRG